MTLWSVEVSHFRMPVGPVVMLLVVLYRVNGRVEDVGH